MRRLLAASAATLTALSFASVVQAQSITPSSFSATMGIGSSVTVHKTITLGPSGANLVDLFFLADNTGSMGGIITNAKNGAAAILGGLPAGISYNFGVGQYFGDPSEFGETPASAYHTSDPLGPSSAAAQAGINTWIASGGGDTPEANFFALQQVANTTSWRAGSQRLVVWFGDATSHTETTTQAQALAALQAKGVQVLGFNSLGAGGGIDGGGQASAITSGTGGSLTNNFSSLTPAQFNAAVNSEISTATSTLDLTFGSTLASSGLSLSFVCTDALGCNHVGGGESRTFDLVITANSAGVYDFSTFANGVAASELDHIVVSATPEPGTLGLMGTGLMGLVGFVRRKRNQQLV